MTIIVASLIFAALLILLSKIPVAIAMARMPEGYNNRYPRDQQASLSGFGKRAVGAHQNCIEAFPLFTAGLLIALWSKAELDQVATLAVVFSISRIVYLACYWLDFDKLRSLSWTAGFLSSLYLMFIALP